MAFSLGLSNRTRTTYVPPARMNPGIVLGNLLAHPDVPNTAQPGLTNIVAGAIQAKAAAGGSYLNPGQAQNFMPPARSGANPPPKLSAQDIADIEHDLYLDPVLTLKRHFRVYYLPGTIANGVMTFAPQRACVPFMLHVPSGSATAAGVPKTIQQMQNGVRQYFATSDQVPATMFTEATPGVAKYLRPMLARVGNTITATTNIANGSEVALACFDMAEDGLLSPFGNPMQIGFNSGNLAVSGGTTIVRIKPQKTFRLRRIELDSTVTNWVKQCDATHGLAVTGITVANDPQTEGQGSLPGTLFDFAFQGGGDLDGDVCEVGAEVDITLLNNDATVGGITVAGTVWGDTPDQGDFLPD